MTNEELQKMDPLPLRFDAEEQRYLRGLYSRLFDTASGNEKMETVWAFLSQKCQAENKYSKMERDLMRSVVDATLKSVGAALTSSENVEAKVRAGSIQSVFKRIKEKLNEPAV